MDGLLNVSDDEDSLKSNLDGESGADGKVSLKSDSFDQAGVDGDGAEPAGVADAALQAGVHLTLGAAVAEIRCRAPRSSRGRTRWLKRSERRRWWPGRSGGAAGER